MATISGGNGLEAALKALGAKVTKAASVDVGFLEGSTYPDGTSVPMVAALNEFGSGKTPARPFFRTMVAAKSGEWPEAVGNLLKANDFDAAKTLAQAGSAISGQLQQSIVDFNSVPLAASTIAAKGNSKQLVDSGVMLASISFVVKP